MTQTQAMQRAKFEALCDLARDGGSLAEIQSLIDEGVDINMKDSRGRTPLLLAAQWAHQEIVQLLIDGGSDIHCCNDHHQFTVLHYAAMKGWTGVVQHLLDKGVDINSKDSYGMTSLLVSADWGRLKIVDLLIRRGADINCCDHHDEWTVLHYAAMRGWQAGVVRKLVEEGADCHARDSNGETALHHAVRRGWREVVEVLLRSGADCNSRNGKGESPFYILLRRNAIGGVGLCVEAGGYVEAFGYEKLLKQALFKKTFLGDTKLCSQVIVNKFNRKLLPALYAVSVPRLPPIDKMKIVEGSWVALEIQKAVSLEIERKGYCNVLEARPLVLSMLCVNSFVKYIHAVNHMCCE